MTTPHINQGALKALTGYLRKRPAEIKRALVRAEEVEERRTGIFHKYKIPDPFERLKAEIALLVCDSRTGELKEWAQELVDGDLRDLAVAILTLVCSQLNVAMSVAVPFAALLAKRGLKRICGSYRPGRGRRSRVRR